MGLGRLSTQIYVYSATDQALLWIVFTYQLAYWNICPTVPRTLFLNSVNTEWIEYSDGIMFVSGFDYQRNIWNTH